MTASLLLHGGTIFVPGDGPPREGALAILDGGRAVRGDRLADLAEHRGSRTRVVDLRGRAVTPGIEDTHIHVSEGGLSLLQVDCRDARSDEEVAARAARRAQEIGPSRFVSGRGWDHHLFPGERWPRRAVLDAACPRNPVLLRRIDGHAAWANSAALALAGITRETRDPPGGRIGRESASGEPDGLLFEDAIDLVRNLEPAPTSEDRLAGLRAVFARARAHGLTAVQDEKGWPELYAELEGRGEMTLRATIWNRVKTPLEDLVAWRASFARLGPVFDRGHLRPGLLKGYLDGSLGSRTAWFWDPYADDLSTSGMCTFDRAELLERSTAADRLGFQLGFHAIGDRAVTLALDAFAAAREANGARDARHRIEHCQNIRDADIPRLVALGAVASMQPSHRDGDDAFFRQRLGPGRLAGAYAWRRLLDAGAHVAFGSDFPVESLDPRTSLAPALEGGLTMTEAVSAFALAPRHARFAEGEPLRDWVVWGADLFRLSPAEVRKVPVDLTVFEGQVVFERVGSPA